MDKKEFFKKQKFFLISVLIFALACAIAFYPQREKLQKEESKISENKGENMSGNQELQITDLVMGEGAEVKVGDQIKIHYHGTLTDGTVFDSSVERDLPFETTIGVGELIKGWDQGIPGMKVGGKRRLVIPASLAYGDRAVGNIPAGSTLIFDVELINIL